MPKSKKNNPSPQLVGYLNESRAHGSVAPVTNATEATVGNKEDKMRVWDENWATPVSRTPGPGYVDPHCALEYDSPLSNKGLLTILTRKTCEMSFHGSLTSH